MAVSYRSVRLGDVADVAWGDTSITKAEYIAAGATAYSASGPDGHVVEAQHVRTGVVLSAIGANAGRTWLARGEWTAIKNTIRFWSTDPEVDTEFLFWATSGDFRWPTRGSAQPFISQGDARNVTIALPALRDQIRVARILGSLERRIAANIAMNSSIDSIVKALRPVLLANPTFGLEA